MKKYCLVSDKEGSYILERDDPKAKMVFEGGTMTSRSTCHDNIEELKIAEGIPEKPCLICNSPFCTHFTEPIKSEMIERNLCFSCNFWTDIIAIKDTRIIMNGVVYVKGKEDTVFKGFGGRTWKIQMNDGTIIETNNLWCNGDVPERFKEQLPDNAKRL